MASETTPMSFRPSGGRRETATTSWPCAASWLTRGRPMKPVAPSTMTFNVVLLGLGPAGPSEDGPRPWRPASLRFRADRRIVQITRHQVRGDAAMRRWGFFILGLALILVGGFLAHEIQ